jgi:RHS repeat-associated protein
LYNIINKLLKYYTYDGAGRKTSETIGGETTLYSYNEWGDLQTSCKGDVVTTYEYDQLRRATKTTTTTVSLAPLSTFEQTYDDSGNIASSTKYIEGKKATTTYRYDTFNRCIETINPLGAVTTVEYRGDSLKITTLPKGLSLWQTYNAAGSLIDEKKYAPTGKLLSYEEYYYDGTQKLLFHKSLPFGTITKKTYNNRSLLETVTEGYRTKEEKTTLYYYSPEKNLEEIHKPNGTILYFTYDPLQRKIREFSSDSTIDHSFFYNKTGEVVKATDNIQSTTTTRTFNSCGRITSETLGNNLSISYNYNDAGLRSRCHLPDNTTIDYTYLGHYLRTVSRNGYTHYFLQYDLSGHLLLEKAINGAKISHTYTLLGQHESITAPNFYQKIDEWDLEGNVVSLDTCGRCQKFAYDIEGNLIEEGGNSYSYDSHASCIEQSGKSLSTDHHHQYTHIPYDENGNPLENNNIKYTYDALGRLLCAEGKAFVAIYTYDPFHRRLSKTVKLHNQETTKLYLYDGYNEIGQASLDGSLEELRILGRSAQSEAGSSLFFEFKKRDEELSPYNPFSSPHYLYIPIHDLFKNVATLIDLWQYLIEQNTYSPFQETSNHTKTINPWRFASKRIDKETSLILFGRRYYDKSSRRWLTPDPIPDHVNPYLFARNNPLSYTDQYGYTACKDTEEADTTPPKSSFYSQFPFLDKPWERSLEDLYPFYIPKYQTKDPTTSIPRVFFNNGIMTTLPEAYDHTKRISQFTCTNPEIGLFYSTLKAY